MQSVASLMSMGKVDVGNLEDLDEDEEEEGGVAVGDSNQRQQVTTEISSITSRMQQLDAHFGNPFEDDDTGQPDDDALNPFGDCLLLFCWMCVCETMQWVPLTVSIIRVPSVPTELEFIPRPGS